MHTNANVLLMLHAIRLPLLYVIQALVSVVPQIVLLLTHRRQFVTKQLILLHQRVLNATSMEVTEMVKHRELVLQTLINVTRMALAQYASAQSDPEQQPILILVVVPT